MEKYGCCSKMFMLLGLYGLTAFPYPFMTMYAMSAILMFMVFTLFGMAGCCYWKDMDKECCKGTKFFMMLSKFFAMFVVVMDVYMFGMMMKWWGFMGMDKFFGEPAMMWSWSFMFMGLFFLIHFWGFYKMFFSCKGKGDCDTKGCDMK